VARRSKVSSTSPADLMGQTGDVAEACVEGEGVGVAGVGVGVGVGVAECVPLLERCGSCAAASADVRIRQHTLAYAQKAQVWRRIRQHTSACVSIR
jgi:hypothetical protein